MTRLSTRALGVLFSLATLLAPGLAAAQKPGAPRPDDIGKELREAFLSKPLREWGITRTPEYPAVAAVGTDYAIDDKIVTVVSLADGSSSIYTTTTPTSHAHREANSFVLWVGRLIEDLDRMREEVALDG